jgi:1-acyl-sn-glycerol-3-phosphate acyltransferase
MFVANHNSWMDIPFVGIAVGWRNYKLISKAELGRVPILGKAISIGGHVMVDRSSRKSQIMTLKSGMQWLKVSRSGSQSLASVFLVVSNFYLIW